MKLRLRSVETKETLRIEVPSPCTLQQLREIISQRLPSFSLHPSSVRLSFNRKDELLSSPVEEGSLQSYGITSGDLIFFTLNPNGFSSETLGTHSQADHRRSAGLPQIFEKVPVSGTNTDKDDPPYPQSLNLDTDNANNMDFNSKQEEIMDDMEVDKDESVVDVGKSFSVHGFLRKVFTKELGDDGGCDHKITVIAVHAVLLESGFIGFDPASNKAVSGLLVSNVWPSFTFMMSLPYILPDIIGRGVDDSDGINYVVLKFQNLGRYINVYGSLADGSTTHWVRLDESTLVPFLNVAWAKCGLTDEINGQNGFLGTTPEREVFMFWRTVKDRIALPLLIDLCEKSGLPLPPCFMRLPTDLKLKILELLPGVDLAKVSYLCSELRYLASSDDLWKQKFLEEFGDGDSAEGRGCWKDKFANCWEIRKRKETICNKFFPLRRRETNPFQFPVIPIIGGDHDACPICLSVPFGQAGRAGHPAWNFVPRCKLGGR